ncbi:2-methylisocitrate lyase [compost metagenome]
MVFEEISRTGTQKDLLGHLQTRSKLYDTIRYYDYEALDGKIARTVLNENE